MPSPRRYRPRGGWDQALTSIVAALLLVAITIAMAGLIYAWTQGYVGGFGSPPAATFVVVGCNAGLDAVTVDLRDGGPLAKDDLAAILRNETTTAEEARTDPLDPDGGTWSTRTRVTIGAHDTEEPAWDGPLASDGGLSPDHRYQLAWVHRPASTLVGRDDFTCDPSEGPDPSFAFASCRPQNDDVTVRLESDTALGLPNWTATLVNASDGSTEATADPLASSGIWRPGSSKTFHEGDQGTGIAWDTALTEGLEEDGTYRIDFASKPTGETRDRLSFRC